MSYESDRISWQSSEQFARHLHKQHESLLQELKEIIPNAEKLCDEKNKDRRYDTHFQFGAIKASIKFLVEKHQG